MNHGILEKCVEFLVSRSIYSKKGYSHACKLVAGLKLEVGAEADADNDSSTDDEEECQFKQRNASRNAQPKSPVVTGLHDVVPGTTNEIASKSSLVEQAVVLRRCSTGRRGKQQFSPEKLGALLLKEKEEKASGYSKGAESNALAKSKGGSVDGSSNLLMESSRDSRRLMQGARQVYTNLIILQLLQELATQQ